MKSRHKIEGTIVVNMNTLQRQQPLQGTRLVKAGCLDEVAALP